MSSIIETLVMSSWSTRARVVALLAVALLAAAASVAPELAQADIASGFGD